MNSKRLYVGNLPYTTTENELKSLFSSAGTVVASSIIMDRATGRSKGFGFVEFSTEDEAEQAIGSFNQSDFGGRSLSVSEAKPREDRSAGAGF